MKFICEVCLKDVLEIQAYAKISSRSRTHLECFKTLYEKSVRAVVAREQEQAAAAALAAAEAVKKADAESAQIKKLAVEGIAKEKARIDALVKAEQERLKAKDQASEEFKAKVADGGRFALVELPDPSEVPEKAPASPAESVSPEKLCVHCGKAERRGEGREGPKHCDACYFGGPSTYTPEVTKQDLDKKLEDAFKPGQRNLEID